MKFGRRSEEQLGNVDPTGSYCKMPEDWIKKKLAEAAITPSKDALVKSKIILFQRLANKTRLNTFVIAFVVSSVPFIGFGFLDNFFMIIAGDYIESSIGVYMCLSTMAAAALGNTISDIFGLGLASYVEQVNVDC